MSWWKGSNLRREVRELRVEQRAHNWHLSFLIKRESPADVLRLPGFLLGSWVNTVDGLQYVKRILLAPESTWCPFFYLHELIGSIN